MDSVAILKAREAVEKYRTAHADLYKTAAKTIPEDHTPLLNEMIKTITDLGFKEIGEVWKESDELVAKELGYLSVEDLKATATAKDKADFAERWK